MRQHTGPAPLIRESHVALCGSRWSIWAWLVLVTCILLWFPLMALLRLVTAPFDPGRYAVGYLFRQIGSPWPR